MNIFIALIDGELKHYRASNDVPMVDCPIFFNSNHERYKDVRWRYQTILGTYRHLSVVREDSPHLKVLKTLLLLEGVL